MWELEPVDFESTQKASRYHLEDGTVLLAQLLVAKVYHVPKLMRKDNLMYQTVTGYFFTTICPKKIRAKPSKSLPDTSQPDKVKSEPIGFSTDDEPWSIVRLKTGDSLFSRIRVAEVRKTEYYLEDGDPLYFIKWNANGFRLAEDLKVLPMQSIETRMTTSS
jgi:hypothetical protein